jgi:molecular chaperone Hsp33
VTDAPSRFARDVADDTALPFQVESLDVRGRVVRLGPLLDRLLARHAYPKPVARLVAEAVVLTALLGSALKFEGRFILQTKGDGPVGLVVVDFESPDKVRACAKFDRAAVEAAIAEGRAAPGELLGAGHLAMTIDQGPDMNRYQGLVALEGGSLEEAARGYLLQSEQIPSVVRLAVAESVTASDGGFRSAWRGAAFLVQFLPESPDRRRMADLPPGDAPEGFIAPVHREDEAWTTARALAETIEVDELVDPSLSPERLLFRLYHEQGVKVFEPLALEEFCRCSEERVADMLRSFTPDERADMTERGRITVTCEFCSRTYGFAAEAVEG